VTFVKPDYFVINDFFEGYGNYEVEFFFQLGFNLVTRKGNRILSVFDPDGRHCADIIFSWMKDASVTIEKGMMNHKISGWLAPAYGFKKKSTSVRLKVKINAPARIDTLIWIKPAIKDKNQPICSPEFKCIGDSDNIDEFLIEVRSQSVCDVLCFCGCEKGEVQYGPFNVQARQFVLRQHGSKPVNLFARDVLYVKYHDQVLMKSEQPRSQWITEFSTLSFPFSKDQ